jgi:mannose-6-phosphate isomerase-like protein (cupin superfamily)
MKKEITIDEQQFLIPFGHGISIDYGCFIAKAWGHELVIHNDEKYCGKVLNFKPNAKFSLHFHVQKEETWFVASGELTLRFIDTKNGTDTYFCKLTKGCVVHIPPGVPHQLVAGADGAVVFEASTPHKDEDSYRIEGGDSQLSPEKIEDDHSYRI